MKGEGRTGEHIEQWSPSFLAPETGFMEDNVYYYYIVTYNEIIIHLTIMQFSGSPEFCIPVNRWSLLGVLEDSDTQSLLLICSAYSVTSSWLLSLHKTLLHEDRILEMEACFFSAFV